MKTYLIQTSLGGEIQCLRTAYVRTLWAREFSTISMVIYGTSLSQSTIM